MQRRSANARSEAAADEPRAAGTPRVLLIQLDAADATLLDEGIERGDYPALARLRERGAWGHFASPPGFGSGATWANFNTAVSAATHGRYFYRQVMPGSYEAQPFEGESFRSPPFWQAFSDAGRRVVVIDAPSIGLTEDINGVCVVDWITHDLVYQELRTYPASFARDLTGRFGSNPLLKCDQPGGRDAAGHERLLAQLLERIDQKDRAIRHYLGAEDWDFFCVAFAEPHCVGHQCWHVSDPRHPLHDAKEAAAVGDPVRAVYAAIDASIGRILDEVDADTTIFVASATGFAPNFTGNLVLDEILRRIEGVEATPQVALTHRFKRWIKRFLPIGIRRRYRPLKREIEESLQAGDRARRKYFMVPHNDIAGAVRLNVAGREASGVLQPGAEVEAAIEELRRELLALRNVETGEPVVERVERVADHCRGPSLDLLPDLFVVWKRKAYPDRVTSERIGEVALRHRGNRTGDHVPIHVFFAAGPGVVNRRLDGLSVYDFGPTIAALLGVESLPTDGRVVEELFAGETAKAS